MVIANSTPLTAMSLALPDRYGAETVVVVVKGTWRIDAACALSIAEEQVPVKFEPTYRGTPGSFSLVADSDVLLEKPGTDCILLGHAYAPNGRMGSVDVSFAVGAVRKTIRVFGERIWMRCMLLTSMSRPAPFERMPLVWERAFGGTDTSSPDPAEHECCFENPVGVGFLGRKTNADVDGTRLPNLEDPACLITRPTDRPGPAGFGPVAPHWQPRAGYAGTFDQQWRRYRNPLPPEDQDPRFHLSASRGLSSTQHLRGNEPVFVENAAKQGRLLFPLPGVHPRVVTRLHQTEMELSMTLDTVIVEPDDDRTVLVWRGKCAVPVHEVNEVRIDLIEL